MSSSLISCSGPGPPTGRFPPRTPACVRQPSRRAGSRSAPLRRCCRSSPLPRQVRTDQVRTLMTLISCSVPACAEGDGELAAVWGQSFVHHLASRLARDGQRGQPCRVVSRVKTQHEIFLKPRLVRWRAVVGAAALRREYEGAVVSSRADRREHAVGPGRCDDGELGPGCGGADHGPCGGARQSTRLQSHVVRRDVAGTVRRSLAERDRAPRQVPGIVRWPSKGQRRDDNGDNRSGRRQRRPRAPPVPETHRAGTPGPVTGQTQRRDAVGGHGVGSCPGRGPDPVFKCIHREPSFRSRPSVVSARDVVDLTVP